MLVLDLEERLAKDGSFVSRGLFDGCKYFEMESGVRCWLLEERDILEIDCFEDPSWEGEESLLIDASILPDIEASILARRLASRVSIGPLEDVLEDFRGSSFLVVASGFTSLDIHSFAWMDLLERLWFELSDDNSEGSTSWDVCIIASTLSFNVGSGSRFDKPGFLRDSLDI